MINGKHADRLIFAGYGLLGLILVCITVLSSFGRPVPGELHDAIGYVALFMMGAQGVKPNVPASAVNEQVSTLIARLLAPNPAGQESKANE